MSMVGYTIHGGDISSLLQPTCTRPTKQYDTFVLLVQRSAVQQKEHICISFIVKVHTKRDTTKGKFT